MQERLLQFIWQHQYFSTASLTTVCGKEVVILQTGILNTNQGPDFLHARIKIGTVFWAGNIEVHIKSSDWLRHHHSEDIHYKNVVLHVVWEHDIDVSQHPVLALKGRVSLSMLQRYENLMQQPLLIPCSKQLHVVDTFIWSAWKTRLVAERLELKNGFILERLKKCNFHWDELCWRLFAKYFGVPVNADAMEALAAHVPLKILRRHKQRIEQLEAILMGQAGLLESDFSDDYPNMLKKEYHFLRHKYQLQPTLIPLQFLRMRPIGFPTIRLSMLACFIRQSHQLFSALLSAELITDVKKMLDVHASTYWDTHYVFDHKSPFQKKKIGKQMVNHLMVNVVLPLLYAYGTHSGEQAFKEKAIVWLEQVAKEKNRVTASWERLGVTNRTAFDSQALLQLQKSYCSQHNCLHCVIGNTILKPN